MKSQSTVNIKNSTLKHLRFSFSFFLLPVFLFALSQSLVVEWPNTLLIFLILHFLVFPATNGYNSYEDKDQSPIGGLKNPPKVTKRLYYTTLVFDILAVLLSLILSWQIALLVAGFSLMSRLYSYRKIRLKRFPIISFLIVFVFQGGWVYLISSIAISGSDLMAVMNVETLQCMLISSLFMGSMYPLTQIYQHEADKADGVITISYLLGYRGTFIFSAMLFVAATILLMNYFRVDQNNMAMLLFGLFLFPVIYRIIQWNFKVVKDTIHANFENTMRVNLLSSTMMNGYFLLLFFNNLFNWF